MAGAAEVRLHGIGKRFGEVWVLRGVTLEIPRGSFYTILGPSGCGKTTLLRIIAGFATPDEGTVSLDGAPVNSVPPWKRDVGLVFQSYALWPHLSVFDNVAFGLRERREPRDSIQQKVGEALRMVNLEDFERRRPSQLSGGQAQRVALARTLVVRPSVLLLDEPLSNLDARLRAEMRIELRRLQQELGITTIYVTHDQEEALALSTRIAVMARGAVVQEGTPRAIYEQPANAFVAEFVGGSNILSAQVVGIEGARLAVELAGGIRFTVARPDGMEVVPGETLLLALRPEAISVGPQEESPGEGNRMPGQVLSSIFQGASVEYELLVGQEKLRAKVPHPRGKRALEPGEPALLSFGPDDALPLQ